MSKVAEYWSTEDVLKVCAELSAKEAEAVLLLSCVVEHDANTGTNWDVLRAWADYVQIHPETVEKVHKTAGERLIT